MFSFSSGTGLEIWRWITSMFLHVSASHLFFNMIGLYFFGKVLEKELDNQWFIAVYFVSGLIGTFIFMFTSAAPVVGASGAVFGVMGAAMLLNPIKRIHIYLFPLPLSIIAITFIIVETFVVFFQPDEFSNVANVAHVAGMLTGSVFAFFNDPKRAGKGVLVLIISLLLLIFLAPFFTIITGVGGFVLGIIDWVIGIVLYNVAGLLGFLWG